MTSALLDSNLSIDLELLMGEKIAEPCQCDHFRCGKGCKGHHIDLYSRAELAQGVESSPMEKPCGRSASWIVSLRGDGPNGYIPPIPRYFCDPCKKFWTKGTFLIAVAEPL